MAGFGPDSSSELPSTTGGSNTRRERPSDPKVLDKVTWPVVALVGVVLAAVIGLSWLRADTAVITNILMALGLGGGLGLLSGIRNNVNGNLEKLHSLLGEAMTKLSQSTPVEPPSPPEGPEA